MYEFTVTRTSSRTHPWRVELNGGEVALCPNKNIAELIAQTLEQDNRHSIVQYDLDYGTL